MSRGPGGGTSPTSHFQYCRSLTPHSMISGQEIRYRRDGTGPFDGVWSRSRPMRPGLPIVVFSDVDGVDCARAGSFITAANTLKHFEPEEVPLVLCSTKTRAEIE